jgi:hypothetical protein
MVSEPRDLKFKTCPTQDLIKIFVAYIDLVPISVVRSGVA